MIKEYTTQDRIDACNATIAYETARFEREIVALREALAGEDGFAAANAARQIRGAMNGIERATVWRERHSKGLSWEDVGEAMGLSRQGAQQKYN